MGEAKPFENTTISAPRGAPVGVRNRDGGGDDGAGIKRSPSLSSRLRFRPYSEIPFFNNCLIEVLLEAVDLVHPLVQDGDNPDVAI